MRLDSSAEVLVMMSVLPYLKFCALLDPESVNYFAVNAVHLSILDFDSCEHMQISLHICDTMGQCTRVKSCI
jgi:hypothetical protein